MSIIMPLGTSHNDTRESVVMLYEKLVAVDTPDSCIASSYHHHPRKTFWEEKEENMLIFQYFAQGKITAREM